MDDKEKHIDNTIKIMEKVLEKNKENVNVKEAYEEFIRLKERRGKEIHQ